MGQPENGANPSKVDRQLADRAVYYRDPISKEAGECIEKKQARVA